MYNNNEKTHSVARVGSSQAKSNWLNQREIRMCDGYQLNTQFGYYLLQVYQNHCTLMY